MNSTTIYIHGFLSSPYSNKGKILEQRHLQRGIPFFIAPEIFVGPEESRRDNYSCRRSGSNGRFCFIGSSLGGFMPPGQRKSLVERRFSFKSCPFVLGFMEDKVGVHYVEQNRRQKSLSIRSTKKN